MNFLDFVTGREAAQKAQAKTAEEVNNEDDGEEDEEDDEDFTEETSEYTPAPTFEHHKGTTVTELAELMGTMSVNNSSSSNATDLSLKFPFISYQYVEDGRKMVSYDFLVIGASKKQFRPE
jgi:TATA-binding protein-associated factor Taf7